MEMHDNELYIDEDIVRRLVADQFPEWRAERVNHITAGGTENAIFRIGARLAARFPRRAADPTSVRDRLTREADAIREFRAYCPFPSPAPVTVGSPGDDYPLPWSVQTWLPGGIAPAEVLEHSDHFAHDIATLLRSLRAADTRGRSFTGTGRGGILEDSDEWMAVCFRESEGLLPVDQLRDLWAAFRVLPTADSVSMTHGDLIPGNLLVEGQRLIGVLDAGGFGPADPALDLVAAWHMLDRQRREVLRNRLAIDDREWRRGAAWAFQQAMGLVWYYRETNPGISALGRSTLARICSDLPLEPLAD